MKRPLSVTKPYTKPFMEVVHPFASIRDYDLVINRKKPYSDIVRNDGFYRTVRVKVRRVFV